MGAGTQEVINKCCKLLLLILFQHKAQYSFHYFVFSWDQKREYLSLESFLKS